MTFLGLVLVLLAGGAVILVATEETSRYILFGYTLEPDHFQMFVAGAVTAAVLLLGIALMVAGTRRSARKRRQMRSARAQTSDRVARLEDEKRELERRLETERAAEDRVAAERASADRAAADRTAAGDRAVERDEEDRDTAPFRRDGAGREPAYTEARAHGPAHARMPGDRLVARGREDRMP
ncbi:hypothetical protein ACIBG4_27250 [Nonomuraea sp. NPDC050383]|uniref:hypothetical protein n=1 Tax=Nonomuraea sp. NPDC050383 TaxID=3364362 RepID=UPI0037B8DD33